MTEFHPAGAATGPDPATATAIVRGILADVLEDPDLTADDDFFQFGGDSLIATRAVALIEAAFGLRIPLVAFFEAPTAAELADLIRARLDG
ncbi:acyl carrier protein [Kribbella speibonae]|uniref:Acyl carrier protein n=1 Tax=Kribbella speibonae TaxID=1572660 RepID=A0A4R0J256_9ACTN|nr:acyl carrier protein [Kribbella speibonae]TCC23727.1 acyl carrier protein [Kribbella speibonae]TCC38226.1 acyl carrier protein [Kribbella speibonae]